MLQPESGNPVEKKGVKVLDCPLYGNCLTQAAAQNWKVWNCEQCPNFKLNVAYERAKFLRPYYQLLAEIYPEFKRKYGPAMHLLQLEF